MRDAGARERNLDSGSRGVRSALHMLSIYSFSPILSAYNGSFLKLLNKSNVYEKQNIY